MPEKPNNPLADENAALKTRVAELEAAKKQAEGDEIIIAEKMSRGLRREQAMAVIKRQRDHDCRKQGSPVKSNLKPTVKIKN